MDHSPALADLLVSPQGCAAIASGEAGTVVRLVRHFGQLDEAISVTSEAVQGVHAVRGSGRIVSDLHRTVDLLGQQKYPQARTFATAARRLLPASA